MKPIYRWFGRMLDWYIAWDLHKKTVSKHFSLQRDYVFDSLLSFSVSRFVHLHVTQPFYQPLLFILSYGAYCNRTIDGMGGCWPDTLPVTYARIQCPDIPVFKWHCVLILRRSSQGFRNKCICFREAISENKGLKIGEWGNKCNFGE